MNRRLRKVLCLLLCLGLLQAGALAGEPLEPSHATMPGQAVSLNELTVKLSLADAVFLGVRANRGIRSAYLDRIAQKFDLRVEEDRFNPKLVLTGRYVAGQNQSDLEPSDRYRAGQGALEATLLSKYGTRFSLSWTHEMANYDAAGRTRNGVGTFTVIQPLLRGAGKNIATADLRRASLAEQVNKLQLKSTVSDTVTQIIVAYYTVLQAQEQLQIARDALSRSRQLLEINKAMIEAGRMAAFDAVQTEADGVNQELAVEEALNHLDESRLSLLRLLALDTDTRIQAVETLNAERTDIQLQKALAMAFEQQPAYLMQIIAADQAEIGLEVARNAQLWDISLVGSASKGRNLNTGATVSSSSRNWDGYAGVQVEIPFGDLSRKQQEVTASVESEKQKVSLDEARQTLEQDVGNAVRDLGTRWRQYEIAQRAQELTQRKLEIEREKLRSGRSSNFQVLSFESDMRDAENARLNSLIAYLNARATLDQTLGTTLESWGIELRD
ncbi:MAG: TolC family protein [Burkholderiaceae bacterium]|jgi:outer membrane protein TolC|nr:TolC family protein [Burkholderiaceae bacterium]